MTVPQEYNLSVVHNYRIANVHSYTLSDMHKYIVTEPMNCVMHVTFIFPAHHNMLTDKYDDVQFIARDTMSALFRRSLAYHRIKMRELFRTHYCPYRRDEQWMCPLSDKVVDEFRLHLSWGL